MDVRTLAIAAVPFPGGAQVAGHTAVSHGVRAVRGQADFDAMVGLESERHGGGQSVLERTVEHENAIVAGSDAQFILGTDHAHGDFAADFALLDFEGVSLRRVTGGPHCGHHHLLAGGDIGGTADDGQGFGVADVDRGDAEPVRIGVRFAGQDFADDHALQSTGNHGHFLQAFDLESAGGQDVGHLLRIRGLGLGQGQPGGEPIQRYFHDGRFGRVGREFSPRAPCVHPRFDTALNRGVAVPSERLNLGGNGRGFLPTQVRHP